MKRINKVYSLSWITSDLGAEKSSPYETLKGSDRHFNKKTYSGLH
jgi:hypothetical protein